MNRMIATTADSRYAPGVALIAENANLKARVHKLSDRSTFTGACGSLNRKKTTACTTGCGK